MYAIYPFLPPSWAVLCVWGLLIFDSRGIDNLVADHKELCKFAFDRGSLDRLGALVKTVTPSEKTVEWEEDEPESISCLREVNVLPLMLSQRKLIASGSFRLHLLP